MKAKIKEYVFQYGKLSIPFVQRKFKLSYSGAKKMLAEIDKEL